MYQLDIGGVIQRSFGVWTKNALPFFLLAAVINLPMFLIQAGLEIIPHTGLGRELGTMAAILGALGALVATVLSLIAQSLLAGMLCYSIFRTIKGEAPSLSESLSMALRNIGPLLLLALLQGMLIGLGFIACIIPGVFLSLMFYVATPALVVERLGPVEALHRSNFLTEGNKLYLLVLLFVVGVANAVIAGLVGGCFAAVTVGGAVASGSKAAIMVATVVSKIPAWLIGALASTFGATLATTVYHDLRQMRDGVNVDELLSVFD